MKKIDKFFDINMVLMTLFVSLESIRDKKKIELVYDIDPTIPKELKGNVNAVTHILTHMLTFVFQNSEKREVVLALHAPQDFLYQESISFVIEDSGIRQEEIHDFLEMKIKSELDAVDGEIIDSDDGSNIHINIPFKLNELGNRRYYRLPDIGMLGKRVLLICKSEKVVISLKKMFKYFLYEVDAGKEAYQKRGSSLGYYDIFVLEDKLVNTGLENLVTKVQHDTDLKYVILRDSNKNAEIPSKAKYTILLKPVMQESIFELIVALFTKEIGNRRIKPTDDIPMISMDKYLNEAFVRTEKFFVHTELKKTEQYTVKPVKITEEEDHAVLDVELGMETTRKMALTYKNELKNFIETFDRSDIYFRDISQAKAVWQIKEFCINLEKQANLIGAQRVAHIAEQISLLFVYNELDDLPVFSAKYHIELNNVISEIQTYLKK